MLPNYILLDLETTGAIPLRDRITEIALIHFKNGIEVDRWQTLVNPKINIPDFSIRSSAASSSNALPGFTLPNGGGRGVPCRVFG